MLAEERAAGGTNGLRIVKAELRSMAGVGFAAFIDSLSDFCGLMYPLRNRRFLATFRIPMGLRYCTAGGLTQAPKTL